MTAIYSTDFKCFVSSVLNKDHKLNGKKFMFDSLEDTAWSSDHGSPQWIILDFNTTCSISAIGIQFQGGFAGKDTLVEIEDKYSTKTNINIYPEDINAKQIFSLKNNNENVKKIKLIFNNSTDFFGRIVIYNLEIYK